MKHKHSLNNIRADILVDTKRFLQCLDSGASVEELSAIPTQIKDKETQFLKKDGTMIAPDLWKLLHNRLVSRMNRDVLATLVSFFPIKFMVPFGSF